MKDAEFNPLELRRMLMDIDRHCDTVLANIKAMKPADAKEYALGAVWALGELARGGLKVYSATDKYRSALAGPGSATDRGENG